MNGVAVDLAVGVCNNFCDLFFAVCSFRKFASVSFVCAFHYDERFFGGDVVFGAEVCEVGECG